MVSRDDEALGSGCDAESDLARGIDTWLIFNFTPRHGRIELQ